MKSPRFRALVLVVMMFAACAGCSKNNKTVVGPPSPDSSIAAANQTLEDILYAQINSTTNPQRPSDINFTPAYVKFNDVLRAYPTNVTAHLGVAVLGMVSLTQDPEVNAAFDEWKSYLDQHTPFQVSASRTRPLGVPLGLTASSDALKLPFDLSTGAALAFISSFGVNADPQLSRIQDILRLRVIPKLQEAVQHLDYVVGNPAYTFIVTPRMQGDPRERPVEVDHTDFLALRASCQTLEALCDMAVAYDVSFAAYDSASLVNNLSKGSSWLTLNSYGRTALAASQQLLLSAVDGVDSTITSLLAETDDQANDVIRVGSNPRAMRDIDSVRVNLPTVRRILSGPYTRILNWDSNPDTPPTPLTVDLARFFTDPITDWKALLPDYTVSTERKPIRVQYHYEAGNQGVVVDVPAPGYYSANFYLQVFRTSVGFDTTKYGYSTDPAFDEPLRQLAYAQLQGLTAIPGYTGEVSVSTSFNGSLDAAGSQSVSTYWSRSWATAGSVVHEPVITWDALTFDQWTWPDATLGGLLPGTTDFPATFGITANNWQRVIVINWTNSVRYYGNRRVPRGT